jgi:hypothetical protein
MRRSPDRPPGFYQKQQQQQQAELTWHQHVTPLLHGVVICWRCTSKDVVCFMQMG